MSEEFYRMKRLPPYVIAEVNAMRHAARQAGRDIIDLGWLLGGKGFGAVLLRRICDASVVLNND